ncbi:MAG TPA: hypothetical protein VGF32_31095 [Streptosporangiaceae bacterium]
MTAPDLAAVVAEQGRQLFELRQLACQLQGSLTALSGAHAALVRRHEALREAVAADWGLTEPGPAYTAAWEKQAEARVEDAARRMLVRAVPSPGGQR